MKLHRNADDYCPALPDRRVPSLLAQAQAATDHWFGDESQDGHQQYQEIANQPYRYLSTANFKVLLDSSILLKGGAQV